MIFSNVLLPDGFFLVGELFSVSVSELQDAAFIQSKSSIETHKSSYSSIVARDHILI